MDEQTIQDLQNRMKAEEQRNQYIVAWLWEFGNTFDHPTLASEARRLALACDPTLVWPAPGQDQNPPQ